MKNLYLDCSKNRYHVWIKINYSDTLIKFNKIVLLKNLKKISNEVIAYFNEKCYAVILSILRYLYLSYRTYLHIKLIMK
jgi:hypothetical protein